MEGADSEKAQRLYRSVQNNWTATLQQVPEGEELVLLCHAGARTVPVVAISLSPSSDVLEVRGKDFVLLGTPEVLAFEMRFEDAIAGQPRPSIGFH